MQDTIFIQMAAYRDPQLLLTLKDCLENAKHPENLRFGITWQHSKDDAWDNLDKYKQDPRFKIIEKDYKESQGVCWARNLLQELYDGEKYTLQLDSHHRFVKDWDEKLINMLKGLQTDGYAKPLITAYIPSYNPDNDPEERHQGPWLLTFDRFIPEGAVFIKPEYVTEKHDVSKPVLGRFYSAHFAFTVGEFATEIRHDPNYYFHGEEISIAVRAFTHGYDLFYPNELIAWHEYTRRGRTKQWDDDKSWVSKNILSHKRNRKLFQMDQKDGDNSDIDLTGYEFGSIRSLRDYEKYAGLDFKTRRITQDALDNNLPKFENIDLSDEDFENSLLHYFRHCIDLPFDKVPETDYDFWCIAFKDKEGKEIYRQDADPEEIKRLMTDPDGTCKIWRSFSSPIEPNHWVVWPHSESKGWLEPISCFI